MSFPDMTHMDPDWEDHARFEPFRVQPEKTDQVPYDSAHPNGAMMPVCTPPFTIHENRIDRTGSILLEAESLVNGDRAKDYGTWKENWGRIRDMCRASGRPGLATVTTEDLMILMVLVKVARETTCPKRDNPVDGAGYFFGLDQVRGE